MHITRRTALWLALIALIGMLTIGIFQAGDDSVPPTINAPITIEGGRAAGHRLTMRSWSIDYDRLIANSDGNTIDLSGIKQATIYTHNRPVFTLTADHLEANLISSDVALSGHIRVDARIHGILRRFCTNAATWVESSQTLTMPGSARITGQRAVLVVDGVSLSAGTGNLKVGRVHGTFRL